MESRQTPPPDEILAQLERILASAPFANSIRSQRFLRYVVESSLKSEEDPLKEYAIAIEVFDRDPSYDPSIDATVRVEAGRLRSRLRDYYRDADPNDRVVIEIPKGAYRASFIALPTPVSPSSEIPAPKSTPQLRPLWLGVGLLVLLLAIVAVTGFLVNRRANPASSHGSVVLAILPFANHTGAKGNDFLTEGLTDNLIRQISGFSKIRVISRAAVDGVNRRDAAGQLGATVLLTGQLEKNAEGRLVLDSELSNASDGTVLKSSQYLPNESDLRPIQADIVQDVLGGLGIPLDAQQSAGTSRPLTTSASAFEDFLRGESAMQNGDEASLITAIQLFTSAVDKDGSFAQAMASIASAHAEIATYFELPKEHVDAARQFAERAIAIDPSNTEAHGVLGLIHLLYDWDFEGAHTELAAADRRDVAIWQLGCTAHLLDRNGNTRHAEEDLQRMLEFNPNSTVLVSELGCVNYYAGRYDQSIQYYRKALAKAPWSVMANWGLGRALGREGKYSEALEDLKHFNSAYGVEHPLILGEIGYLAGLSGDRPAALATIARLQTLSKTRYVDPYFIAITYLGLKDRKNTYAWLDKAYDIRSPFLISIATDPKWRDEQGDAGFQALWNRMTIHKRAPAAQTHAVAMNKSPSAPPASQ